MAKYKVGEELIIINDLNIDNEKLKELTYLSLDNDFAQISWGIKILHIEYDEPDVTLTYKNIDGVINKVFACCKDIKNFDKEKVLEKALLKAFQSEIINISVDKNNNKNSSGNYKVNKKLWEMFKNGEIAIATGKSSDKFLKFCHECGMKWLSGNSLIEESICKPHYDEACYFYRKNSIGCTFIDDSVRPIKTYDELMNE